MIISVRFSEEDGGRMKAFADAKGISVSELLRSAVRDRIDYEYGPANREWEVVREQTAYAVKKRRKSKNM